MPNPYVVVQSLLFLVYYLNIRKLGERGLNAFEILYLQSLAYVPGLAFLLFAWLRVPTKFTLHSDVAWLVIALLLSWAIHQFLVNTTLVTTTALSTLTSLQYLVSYPMVAVLGFVINGDVPPFSIAVATAMISFGLALEPRKYRRVSKPEAGFLYFFALVFVLQLAGTLDVVLYRHILVSASSPLLAIALYIAATSISTAAFFRLYGRRFIRVEVIEAELLNGGWLAWSIPALWFLASVPEGFAYRAVPALTVTLLGTLGVVAFAFSDIRHGRISITVRTVVFLIFVVSGVLVASLSPSFAGSSG